MTCNPLIWIVVAVAFILLALMWNSSRKQQIGAVFLERDILVSAPDKNSEPNPYAVPSPIPGPPIPPPYSADSQPLVGGGGGCGCKEVAKGSHAGKILAEVDPRVRNQQDLDALATGGSSRDSAYVCVGGSWRRANNLNAYQGLVTGGATGSAGAIRFSNRSTELIMGGAPAEVLSKVHLPAFRNVGAMHQAIHGGRTGGSKYFAALTGGGKMKWFSI